ncbi:hypothetical protein VKT23_016013 [Stygiomarasmius scandens]|uniref:F-box domain-containing protein n=1 Tax=Marasmiellus scandens TaxID=2682957 RepID=A0ABR1IYN6_9AGAR
MIRRNDFKIQRLHLQDLPDELIDMIFGYLPPRDARDLASTSGRLRNVGLAYAYTSQSLIFPSFIEYRETDVRGSRTFRRKPEKDFVDRCKHLSSRPECVSGLQRLKFGLHFSEDDAFSFFPASISHCIQEVLRNCSNLTTLTIQRLNLSEDWIEVISSMRQLHTMVLEFHCFIGREIAQKVVRDEVPTLAQIRNLTIKWGHDDDIEVAWWILSLFPFLITFNHLKNPDRGRSILLPAPPLQHWRPLFSTLRHLLISDLDPSELPSLWEWMVCAVTHLEGVENSSRLDSLHIPLTHLKLDFIVPIRDSEVINFLIMLGNLATLQVLALNGIEDGSLALVTRIAKIFPDLKGLTLFRSGVAQDSFAGDWPSYTWEYASIFSRFNRLEYFGWNYNVNSFIYPKSLLMFEADNPEECYGRDFWQDEDWHFECTEALARMFAAFCPTFRMLAMHYDETDNAEYYAVRRNGLQIRNEERYSESEWRRDRWDPHSVFSGWESDGK